MNRKPTLSWLVFPISLGAFVATWGGWAKLATMTGYGPTELWPGSGVLVNTGVVLPLTVEPFGALAMAVAFNSKVKGWARVIAGLLAFVTLVAAGVCQVVVHQLTVAGETIAPAWIVGITSVLPVVALGLSGGLVMLNAARKTDAGTSQESPGKSVWGRIGMALGEAAASRAEGFAASQGRPEPRPTQSPRTHVPTFGDAPPPPYQGQLPELPQAEEKPSRDDIPAGQRAFKDLPREEQRRLVAEGRQRDPRPTFEALGREFGISTSQADRLAKEYEKALGSDPVVTPVPGYTHPFEVKIGEERATAKINGFDHAEESKA